MASDIKFRATVDSKKGEVSLQNLDKRVDKLGKTTTRAQVGFKSLAAGVAVGMAAFYAASKALRGLTRWMGDAVDKAAIQQTAEKEVKAALESTGREVANNTEHFKEYASELQNATTYGDEQILSAQALMIQLTKLDREGLDMATKGAIGLASVYKTDLQAATTLVGKALAGNFGALSRYGIMVDRTMTAEQKKASVLQQLQVMYSRAEADVDTYRGAMIQLSNVYGDLKEEVGKAVTENENFRDAIKQITEFTKDLIDSGLVEWATDIAIQAIKSAPMMKSLAESLGMVLLIYKAQAEEQGKVNETMQEWFKHLQLNDELQRSLREQVEGATEAIEEQAEATEEAAETASIFERAWGKIHDLETAALIREAVEELDNMALVGPGLQLAWEQSQVGMEQATIDFIETIIPALRGMTEEVTEDFERMGEMAKGTLLDAAGEAGAILSRLGRHHKGLALAGAIISTAAGIARTIEYYPFPLSAIMAAFQAALGTAEILTIMGTDIPSAAKGAYLPRETILEAGHGKYGELVLRPEQLPQVVKEVIREPFKAAGGEVNITVIVRDQLDPYVAQRITRQQIIPQILEALDINQEKRKWQDRLGIA